MPLRNDLLNPISADSPTGKNLRYDPLYDKIREARREDPPDAQGEWRIERKLADWLVTIKLTSEALATKTKDIQLAVWLAQALLRREGIASFRDGLELVRQMMETFWDGIYPEIEDGDLDLRKAPLEWIGTESDREPNRPVTSLKLIPVTRGGLTYIQFTETREVGSEDAADSYEKQQARAKKIEEGKTAPEVFDKDFDSTPKDFYVDLEKTFDGTIESLTLLGKFCDEKFGDSSPSLRELHVVLQEIRQAVHTLLVRKRETEPDAPSEVAPAAEEASPDSGGTAAAPAGARSMPASGKPAALGPLAPLPVSWDDAVARVVASARFMRQQDAGNPAPYLLLRGLRWGELRESRTSIDPAQLAAPPTEIRQSLRRVVLESNWAEVLETAETAMGMECGRGWLDLQRHVTRACQELGHERVRRAVIAELRTLLETYPQLPEMCMMDEMPTANAETLAWIKKQVLKNSPADAELQAGEMGGPAAAGLLSRVLELAMQAAQAGRPEVCVELLTREISREPSGRARFQRRVQLAQLCHGAGNDAVATTLLQAAVAEIEERKLEEWEAREMLAYPLGLFYQCLLKSDDSSDERDRVYTWMCRLHPLEAMKLER
jgi:type VI secretion system protein ImpA